MPETKTEAAQELQRVHLNDLTAGEMTKRNHFHALKVYLEPDDYNDIIVRHLSEEQRKQYANCSWVPVDVHLNTTDMSVEGVFVPAL